MTVGFVVQSLEDEAVTSPIPALSSSRAAVTGPAAALAAKDVANSDQGLRAEKGNGPLESQNVILWNKYRISQSYISILGTECVHCS